MDVYDWNEQWVPPQQPATEAPPVGPVSATHPFWEPADFPMTPAGSRRRWTVVGGVALAMAAVAAAFSVGRLAGDESVADMVSVAGEDQAAVATPRPADDPATAADPQTAVAPELPPPLVTDPVGAEEPIADVAEAVLPSVVQIEIREDLDNPLTAIAQGSGIVMSSNTIVTNAHVVAGADEVIVRFGSGQEVVADVIGADTERDVAVVQVLADVDMVPATFASLDTVRTGQLAVAIGSPFSLEQSVTAGIVSAVGRPVFGVSNAVVEMIQTDAAINPGNSGGALADRSGRVIGMNSSIRTDGTVQANVGVGFAIPSDTFLLVAERLIAGESVETGFLGIRGITPTTGEPGALVDCVTADTPAALAGLEAGDLIVEIEGEEIANMGDLGATVQLHLPGEEIAIEFVRDGRRLETTAVLADSTVRTASADEPC